MRDNKQDNLTCQVKLSWLVTLARISHEKFIFKMVGFLPNKSRRGGIASSTLKH
jgi:hypothetical protein